jgi:hypothetical protein
MRSEKNPEQLARSVLLARMSGHLNAIQVASSSLDEFAVRFC